VNEKTGEIIETLSIITTPPNSLTGKIHNNPDAPNGPRMLLLIKQGEALNYLNENLNMNEIKKFFNPYDEKEMKAHTVLRFQKKENAEFFNALKITEYFEYPELAA
jgi:putative SOS response-associated peptidase YedK